MINVDQHDCDDKVRRCSSFSALPQPCLHWSESDGYSDSDHIQIHHNQTAGRIYQIRTTDFNLANKCLSSHHFVPNKQTTLAASMPARTRSLPYIYPFSCQSNSIPTYMELTHSWLAFQITPLSVSEVIWDQTTSNFLVYNLQLPHITSNFLMPWSHGHGVDGGHGSLGGRGEHGGHGGQERTGLDRTGQDRKDWGNLSSKREIIILTKAL